MEFPLFRSLLDFIYPPRCLLCTSYLRGEKAGELCGQCSSKVRYVQKPICYRCGKPFFHEYEGDSLCGECIVRKRYFGKARSVAFYRGTIRDAVHCLKYRLKRCLSVPLGLLMVQRASSFIERKEYQVIMPVPLHPKRLKERGFNQALSLAQVLGKHGDIPLDRYNLVRKRYTKSQVGLSERERRKNVRDAFSIVNKSKVNQKVILLVDDVYTSGTTVNECSKVLMNAGAQRVDVLTLARV